MFCDRADAVHLFRAAQQYVLNHDRQNSEFSSYSFYIVAKRHEIALRASFAPVRDVDLVRFTSCGFVDFLRSKVYLTKTYTRTALGLLLNGMKRFQFSYTGKCKKFEAQELSFKSEAMAVLRNFSSKKTKKAKQMLNGLQLKEVQKVCGRKVVKLLPHADYAQYAVEERTTKELFSEDGIFHLVTAKKKRPVSFNAADIQELRLSLS